MGHVQVFDLRPAPHGEALSAGRAGADDQAPAVQGSLLHDLDQLMHPAGAKNGILGPMIRDLVHHVYQDIAIARPQQPVGDGRGDPADHLPALQAGRLFPVKVVHDHDHTCRVGRLQHASQPLKIGGLERPIRLVGRVQIVVIDLWRIDRAAALQAHRHGQQSMPPILCQRRAELVRVPVGVPPPRIGIAPVDRRLGVLVVKDRLNHAAVK